MADEIDIEIIATVLANRKVISVEELVKQEFIKAHLTPQELKSYDRVQQKSLEEAKKEYITILQGYDRDGNEKVNAKEAELFNGEQQLVSKNAVLIDPKWLSVPPIPSFQKK